MTPADGEQAYRAAELAARSSYGKLVAYLTARSRDVAGAEDALGEAFTAALADWPKHGVPERPEAWLLAVARRKQIDAGRRRRTGDAALPQLQQRAAEIASGLETPGNEAMPIPDRRLALMFACAHPAIDPAIRAPLMLQTVLGLNAEAIAAAFLISPAAMAQRLVRAKSKIKESGIPFREPAAEDLPERLEAVLEAIYAAFTEGWPAADDAAGPMRRDLATEAIFLGRLVAGLLPSEPETRGLLALMLFAEARRTTRRTADGSYIPLSQQDTAHWDRALTAEAEQLLRDASAAQRVGRFQLEAAVQSVHAARAGDGRTDWAAVEELYDGLLIVTQSPVVAINRAIAIAENRGPLAALTALAEIESVDGMARYQPFWAAKAAMLDRAGDPIGAGAAYAMAIRLTEEASVREFLQARRQALHRLCN